MATTTNYAWETPDDTDLVKDGAAAIRTLGSSIDTTVKNLSPGTTAGDIDYYTSATAKARRAIGTAGQVLTVNAGATAPEWTTLSPGGWTLISTTTLSGSSTSITVPSGYVNLQVLAYGLTNNTANGYSRMTANSSTNIYDYQAFGGSDETNETSFATRVGSIWPLNWGRNAANASLRTDSANSYSVTIRDYLNTSGYKSFTQTSDYMRFDSNRVFESLNGTIRTTSAITSLQFTNSGGTWATGTVLLYGVK